MTKNDLAKKLGISRASLYYTHKQEKKDEELLEIIKQVMKENPSYGHRRIAIALGINHKKALRVMKKFNLFPALRRIKSKYNFSGAKTVKTEINLIKNICPISPNIIWVTDFTYIRFKNKFVYLATVLDVFSRKVIGWHLSLKQDSKLTQKAIEEALKQGKPGILHSDRGAQYQDRKLIKLLEKFDIQHSKSDKSSPWQNSWQESFYSQFKLELNGTGKYPDYQSLIDAISSQIEYYNFRRIHSKLRTSPQKFLDKHYETVAKVVLLSEKMGT